MHSESVQKHESSRRAKDGGDLPKRRKGELWRSRKKTGKGTFLWGGREGGREQALQSKGRGKARRGRRREVVRDVPSPRQGNESWHLSVLLPLSTHTLSLSLSLSLFRPSFSPQPPSPGYEMVGPTRREEEEGSEKEQRGEGDRGQRFQEEKGGRGTGKGKGSPLRCMVRVYFALLSRCAHSLKGRTFPPSCPDTLYSVERLPLKYDNIQ